MRDQGAPAQCRQIGSGGSSQHSSNDLSSPPVALTTPARASQPPSRRSCVAPSRPRRLAAFRPARPKRPTPSRSDHDLRDSPPRLPAQHAPGAGPHRARPTHPNGWSEPRNPARQSADTATTAQAPGPTPAGSPRSTQGHPPACDLERAHPTAARQPRTHRQLRIRSGTRDEFARLIARVCRTPRPDGSWTSTQVFESFDRCARAVASRSSISCWR